LHGGMRRQLCYWLFCIRQVRPIVVVLFLLHGILLATTTRVVDATVSYIYNHFFKSLYYGKKIFLS
jgi:hypothetical protein